MTKKKQPAVEAATPVQLSGYRRAPRYRWFELPSGEEGAEPLKVRVQTNLSFGQKRDIPTEGSATFRDVFEAIAGYVVEWNYTAENLETGQVEPVPPPADSDLALYVLDELEVLWLVSVVKNPLQMTPKDEQDERAKTSAGSALTDDSPNGDDSASEG